MTGTAAPPIRYTANMQRLPTEPSFEKPIVVVLHGWGLSSFATRYWCRRLALAGFTPSPFSYKSLRRTLNDNVDRLAVHIRSLHKAGQPIHLVGHSLGGIMIMQCLVQHRFDHLGRVVMVGTPYQDSAVMKQIKARPHGPLLLGRTIVQWKGVNPKDLPAGLELGTIAGTVPLGIGRLLGHLEPPHDGTVSVAETHVPFAKDILVLPVTHSEMLLSSKVTHQISAFLHNGQFERHTQRIP